MQNRAKMHRRRAGVALLGCILLPSYGCAGPDTASATAAVASSSAPASSPDAVSNALTGANPLSGSLSPIRDPSIAREGNTWYMVSTDDADLNTADGYLPIHCSADMHVWSACGHVFATLPAWIGAAVPGTSALWAPDLSFFGGLWHLYYSASTLFSQVSAIGLATSPTLNPAAPNYGWTDRGLVIASTTGSDFNALDPSVTVDASGVPWLNYGSFWSGIKQQQIDSTTGLLASGGTRYNLAASPQTPDHAIEAPSMLLHGGYYYLFASTGHCCEASLSQDNYNIIVGRSTSPHGPFLDSSGDDLMNGGGTVLLTGSTQWVAPGSASAWTDPVSGENLLAFHSLDMQANGVATLWLQSMAWQNGWPVLGAP